MRQALFLAAFLALAAVVFAQETVDAWQAAAITKYPALSQKSTALNAIFLAKHKEKQSKAPEFFDNPKWPMLLADESAAQEKEVNQKAQVVKIRERMIEIQARIAANRRSAFTPHEEKRKGSTSYSNVSKDFDRLMAENRELEQETGQLEAALTKLGAVSDLPPDDLKLARLAADGYIGQLMRDGQVFGGNFRAAISYIPSTVEVIYTLDYMDRDGGRIQGPYTVTLERNSVVGWWAIGGSPGDRRANFTKPVIGRDGTWRRSPMEQTVGTAIGR
jgi:hypothetical protein